MAAYLSPANVDRDYPPTPPSPNLPVTYARVTPSTPARAPAGARKAQADSRADQGWAAPSPSSAAPAAAAPATAMPATAMPAASAPSLSRRIGY